MWQTYYTSFLPLSPVFQPLDIFLFWRDCLLHSIFQHSISNQSATYCIYKHVTSRPVSVLWFCQVDDISQSTNQSVNQSYTISANQHVASGAWKEVWNLLGCWAQISTTFHQNCRLAPLNLQEKISLNVCIMQSSNTQDRRKNLAKWIYHRQSAKPKLQSVLPCDLAHNDTALSMVLTDYTFIIQMCWYVLKYALKYQWHAALVIRYDPNHHSGALSLTWDS